MLIGLSLPEVAGLLVAGVLLDLLLGEPRRWHPLVGFGALAARIETLLNRGRMRFARGLLAWSIFNGYSVSTLGSNFSQVVFQFKVSPELLWNGLKWALGIGLVGGLFPALRAARLPVTAALRAT